MIFVGFLPVHLLILVFGLLAGLINFPAMYLWPVIFFLCIIRSITCRTTCSTPGWCSVLACSGVSCDRRLPSGTDGAGAHPRADRRINPPTVVAGLRRVIQRHLYESDRDGDPRSQPALVVAAVRSPRHPAVSSLLAVSGSGRDSSDLLRRRPRWISSSFGDASPLPLSSWSAPYSEIIEKDVHCPIKRFLVNSTDRVGHQ